MRRAGRVDANHTEVVKAIRSFPGATVLSLANVGKGCPDLLVGIAGRNLLIEVKVPGGELTPAQEVFHDDWRGDVSVVYSPDQALDLVSATYRSVVNGKRK